MKSKPRALVATAALFGLFTAADEARADSKQECAAAYEKTQALREGGHLRDARIQAALCSASTCSVYVTKDCIQWLTEIDALLPTVIFTTEEGAGINILAVRVMVDGQPVAAKLDGEAMSLDPGEHVVRFEMDGAEAVEQKVVILQGEKKRKLAVSFKKAPPAKPPVLPRAVPPPPPPAVTPPPMPILLKPHAAPEPAPPSESVPLWIPVSGGLGVLALLTSVGFAMSISTPRSDVGTNRNLSLGSGTIAVMGIGVAVIGIVTTPSKASSPRKNVVLAPFGSPSGGGLTMQGQF